MDAAGQTTMHRRSPRTGSARSVLGAAAVVFMLASMGGCGPNKANVRLRKEKQELEARIVELERRHQADQARILTLAGQKDAPAILSQAQLETLFTVHSIRIGRSTGAVDLDGEKAGDEGIKIYLTPRDEAGDPLKATGQVTIDLLEPERTGDPRIGHWEMDPAELKKTWRQFMQLNAFVITLPWQTPPTGAHLVVDITFRDTLTARTYREVVKITARPPAGP